MKPANHDMPPARLTDAEKYRWIRANRGNYAINEALANSDRDADFDARIEAGIRAAAAGRHYDNPLRALFV